MLKRVLIAGALAALCLGASADNYLHIQTGDGNWKVYDVDRLDKLTFDKSSMTVTDKSGQKVGTFDRSKLATLQVNDDPNEAYDYSDIESVTFTAAITLDGRTLTVGGSGAAPLTVADASGRSVFTITAYRAGQSVDLTALPAGIYIVTAGKQSAKIALK